MAPSTAGTVAVTPSPARPSTKRDGGVVGGYGRVGEGGGRGVTGRGRVDIDGRGRASGRWTMAISSTAGTGVAITSPARPSSQRGGRVVGGYGRLSVQRGREGVDRSERVGGEGGGVIAQTSASSIQPPQDRSNSIPVVAAVDLVRRHVVARAYALGLPLP